MSRAAVDQLLYLVDQSFEGNGEHSLIADLRSLTPEDWNTIPPGGGRSIAHIVGHVLVCKLMYDHYAFGEARLNWLEPLAELLPGCDVDPRLTIDAIQRPPPDLAPRPDQLVAWLTESHRRLRNSVEGLDDAGLMEQRKLNWGGTAETRWIITVMIQHDLFHAGEINHLRALLQQNDRWAWESEAGG